MRNLRECGRTRPRSGVVTKFGEQLPMKRPGQPADSAMGLCHAGPSAFELHIRAVMPKSASQSRRFAGLLPRIRKLCAWSLSSCRITGAMVTCSYETHLWFPAGKPQNARLMALIQHRWPQCTKSEWYGMKLPARSAPRCEDRLPLYSLFWLHFGVGLPLGA